jgi:hypothetical protein
MYIHKAGYRANGEPMATHSRRRYRLVQGNPALGLPQPDPSLWLIHYSKASPRDQMPAANVPITQHTHALLQARRLIQSQGQLPRKEFMLHDRSNWPVIHLPPGVARVAATQGLPGAVGHRRGGSMTQEPTVEEEEDVSRGDILDFMSPRDISKVRYEQHHEWMEEIIESPYPTLSIVPSELGFGRKGQLEELTKDFFDAPVTAESTSLTKVGRMAPGQADDFLKRASDKIAAMQAELEDMRKRHEQRMKKMRRSTTLTQAERKLRTVSSLPERNNSTSNGTDGTADIASRDGIDEIMESVQADMGQKLAKTAAVTLVSRGGLQERKQATPVPVQPPTPAAPKIASPAAIAEVAKHESTPTPVVPPVQQMPNPEPQTTQQIAPQQPQAPAQPEIPTTVQPVTNDMPQASEDEAQQGASDDNDQDVDMEGMDLPAPDENTAGDEWVMIGEDAGQNDVQMPEIPTESQAQDKNQTSDQHTEQTSIAVPQQAPIHQEALNTPDFDLGGEFDNVDVDTAGDALASYGDDDDLNLDNMEGSAFGDAFHPEDEDIS